MELKDMITRRRSCRKYSATPVDAQTLEKIEAFASNMKPLYPEIPTAHRIVTADQVRFYFPWKAPQLVAIFSRQMEGYGENVGFLYQQLDLYLQSLGLGSCWMGLGKLRQPEAPEGMDIVILLAFGYPEEPLREGVSQFKRKPLGEIADREDPLLEPARLAPSSTNSQPWFFTHEGDAIHAFCSCKGLLKHKMLGTMNRIDMGIALAHMFVSFPESFRFFRGLPAETPSGCLYIGSFSTV